MIRVLALLVLGILRSVDGQDTPASVQVQVRTSDDGTVQFICVEDSKLRATKFTWRRKDSFDSDTAVELGSGKTLSGKNFPSGHYICEVTTPTGKSSGSLHFYIVPGSSSWLDSCLWFTLLSLMIGVFIYWYRCNKDVNRTLNKED
ncbi:uncharacterized protein ACMZJ9_002792 isoform 2-T2 [Mantella aurantiaca]